MAHSIKPLLSHSRSQSAQAEMDWNSLDIIPKENGGIPRNAAALNLKLALELKRQRHLNLS